MVVVLLAFPCAAYASDTSSTGFSYNTSGPKIINDLCAEPLIVIPSGCFVTDLLIFNDANYVIEVVKEKGKTIMEQGGGSSGGDLSSSATSMATDAVNTLLNASVERSSGGAGNKYKEVNIWELSKDNKEGTFIEYIKEDICIWNDDPEDGSYLYKSSEDSDWKKSDKQGLFDGPVCGLSELSDGAKSYLSENIPGLGDMLANCVGSWGTIKPYSGFAVHASDLPHGAHVGYRGLDKAGVAGSVSDNTFQFGLPAKAGCFDAGEASVSWEDGVKETLLVWEDIDTFLIVVWQQEFCCMKSL